MIFNSKKKAILPENFHKLTPEDQQKAVEAKLCWYKTKNHFFMKLIFTIFLMFVIECVVFCLYNFYHKTWKFDHWLFVLSLIFAILFLVIMFCMWVKTLLVPMKDEMELNSGVYSDGWKFVYGGLKHS